jgi:hypothetical protein
MIKVKVEILKLVRPIQARQAYTIDVIQSLMHITLVGLCKPNNGYSKLKEAKLLY